MRLLTVLVALLFVPAGRASAQPPLYPPLATLTYERVPTPNNQLAALFAEARRFHQQSDDVPHPAFSVERCLHHYNVHTSQTRAAFDAALAFGADAQRSYQDVLSAGHARYAMAAAEQLGRLNESLANRLSEIRECHDEVLTGCYTAMGLDAAWAQFYDRAYDAMLFCDRVAMHFHHHETPCQEWLSQHDYRFDGNPMELTGQRRYERSDWARNGLSHIASTTNHDRP